MRARSCTDRLRLLGLLLLVLLEQVLQQFVRLLGFHHLVPLLDSKSVSFQDLRVSGVSIFTKTLNNNDYDTRSHGVSTACGLVWVKLGQCSPVAFLQCIFACRVPAVSVSVPVSPSHQNRNTI